MKGHSLSRVKVLSRSERKIVQIYIKLTLSCYRKSTSKCLRKMTIIFSTLEELLADRHPLTFIILIPVFIILLRFARRWLSYLGNTLFWGSKTFSPGFFVPRIVPGSVYPYGIVELKGRRPYMEDRHVVVPKLRSDPNMCLYGVFDGHGGAAASQYCTEYLSKFLEDALSDTHAHPRDALKHAFKKTDNTFLEMARVRGMDDGTTALCVLAHGDTLTIANAGDSRAVAVKVGGQTLPLSFDHKPDRSDERDRITELGGSVVHWGVWRVEGVLAVSRAIGDRLLKEYVISEPEVVKWVCSSDDMFIVLATDGLWDVFTNHQVGAILQNCRNPQQGAETLAHQAFLKGSTDNVTVMVVDVRARNVAEATATMHKSKSALSIGSGIKEC